MSTYSIVRFYADNHDKLIVKTGLTLEQAQDHCSDPETSSATCTSSAGLLRTRMHGAWFDGYTEE